MADIRTYLWWGWFSVGNQQGVPTRTSGSPKETIRDASVQGHSLNPQNVSTGRGGAVSAHAID